MQRKTLTSCHFSVEAGNRVVSYSMCFIKTARKAGAKFAVRVKTLPLFLALLHPGFIRSLRQGEPLP